MNQYQTLLIVLMENKVVIPNFRLNFASLQQQAV